MTNPASLTRTDLIASASDVLTYGGYQPVSCSLPDWDATSFRIFEDKYNVVGVIVFDTCAELLGSWADIQGRLVDLISKYVSRGEAKSWDGYLVLLTSGLPKTDETLVEAIRYNTTRLRKIVATGDDLRSTADVDRVLRPLLPLATGEGKLRQTTVLDLLPELLAKQGIPTATTEVLVEAFRKQKPLMESLHGLGTIR